MQTLFFLYINLVTHWLSPKIPETFLNSSRGPASSDSRHV